MTLDGKILRGLFEHERLKLTIIRTQPRKHSKFSRIKTHYECQYEDHIILYTLCLKPVKTYEIYTLI